MTIEVMRTTLRALVVVIVINAIGRMITLNVIISITNELAEEEGSAIKR